MEIFQRWQSMVFGKKSNIFCGVFFQGHQARHGRFCLESGQERMFFFKFLYFLVLSTKGQKEASFGLQHRKIAFIDYGNIDLRKPKNFAVFQRCQFMVLVKTLSRLHFLVLSKIGQNNLSFGAIKTFIKKSRKISIFQRG